MTTSVQNTGLSSVYFPSAERDLPDEITLRIFSLLPLKELLNATLVCKSWKSIIGDRTVWKEYADNLSLGENLSDYRKAVSEKIANLKSIIGLCDPYLIKEVKTAKEFDSAFFGITWKFKTKDEQEKAHSSLIDEMNSKFKFHKVLENGYYAHRSLCLINRSPIEKLKEYATVIATKYGQEDLWTNFAITLIKKGKINDAVAMLNNELKTNWRRDQVIVFHVSQLCNQSKIIEAWEFFRKNTNREKKCYELSESMNTILYHAKDNNLLGIVESIIDDFVETSFKLREITQLIKIHLKSKNNEEVKRLLDKYEKDLQSATGNYQSQNVIELYVSTMKLDKAWDLALKAQDKDKLALYYLRNALEDSSLESEAEKVRAFIREKTSKASKNEPEPQDSSDQDDSVNSEDLD